MCGLSLKMVDREYTSPRPTAVRWVSLRISAFGLDHLKVGFTCATLSCVVMFCKMESAECTSFDAYIYHAWEAGIAGGMIALSGYMQLKCFAALALYKCCTCYVYGTGRGCMKPSTQCTKQLLLRQPTLGSAGSDD